MKRCCCALKTRNWLSLGLVSMVALVLPIPAIADEVVSVDPPCPNSLLESPSNLQLIEIKLYDAYFEGDYFTASRYANQLIQCDSSQSKYYILLGNSNLGLGKIGQAIQVLRTAVDLEPESATAHLSLANSLLIQGDHDAAFAAIEQAYQLNPNHLGIRLELAMQYEGLGMNDRALELFQQAISANPESDLLHFLLGMLKLRSGIDDYGTTEFLRALQINPDYREAENWLEHSTGSFWLEHHLEREDVPPRN